MRCSGLKPATSTTSRYSGPGGSVNIPIAPFRASCTPVERITARARAGEVMRATSNSIITRGSSSPAGGFIETVGGRRQGDRAARLASPDGTHDRRRPPSDCLIRSVAMGLRQALVRDRSDGSGHVRSKDSRRRMSSSERAPTARLACRSPAPVWAGPSDTGHRMARDRRLSGGLLGSTRRSRIRPRAIMSR
jgi:hypothetical protein